MQKNQKILESISGEKLANEHGHTDERANRQTLGGYLIRTSLRASNYGYESDGYYSYCGT